MSDVKTEHLLGLGSKITIPDVVDSGQGSMYWEGEVTAINASTVSVRNTKTGEVIEVSHKEIERGL